MQGKNGENYKKTALTSIRLGLQRYFILKRGFNIIVDDAFKQSNQVFFDHHEPIKKDDLAKIYSSYDQSSPNFKSLQHFGLTTLLLFHVKSFREDVQDAAFQANLTN